ncbi:DEKNAAC102438 [Brettanomyces naardenensis]|uniref:DEKNAAC102439 n=1 Tax=Brettanomyces naardenensis TaxID=13370 RepID=A0A448YK83_BRENA|nr:DEKNAAC102438 [Brettanomyces naardenensis]
MYLLDSSGIESFFSEVPQDSWFQDVTITALTAKATLLATQRYSRLSFREVARLNNIKLINPQASAQEVYFSKLFAQYPGGFQEKMNQNEALLILGINKEQILNLTPQIVRSRHRKMMVLNHPDRGGSPYMAMKINTAKDLLDKTFTFK